MGLFKLMHDFIGVNTKKLTGSIRQTADTMREQRDKLRSCDKVRKLRYKPASFK